FKPATVDGNAVPVRMSLRAVFADREGQPPLLLLRNLGHMQADFGPQYVEPQERPDLNTRYDLYASKDWSEGSLFFDDKGDLTRVMAQVSEEGNVTAVRRIEAHGRQKRDAVEVEKNPKQARFIPGFVDGQPTPMRYFAVLHHTKN